jgi:hypothetical protein
LDSPVKIGVVMNRMALLRLHKKNK